MMPVTEVLPSDVFYVICCFDIQKPHSPDRVLPVVLRNCICAHPIPGQIFVYLSTFVIPSSWNMLTFNQTQTFKLLTWLSKLLDHAVVGRFSNTVFYLIDRMDSAKTCPLVIWLSYLKLVGASVKF